MRKMLNRMWEKFLTVFGDVKIHKWPLFLQYDPLYFSLSGDKILEISQKAQPGDIILRGYDNYLDSYFIQSKRSYSHAGLYVGDNDVIHAVSPCVQKTNIVDFCECDRIAVLRPKRGVKKALKIAKKFLEDKIPYDFFFKEGTISLYCFELARECYPDLNVSRSTATALFGLIKKPNVVLSDDLFKSKDFELVFEFNPKYNINLSFD